MCGESILPEASICPHCRSEVLFDVRVTAEVQSRDAYHLARELESIPDLTVDFLFVKRALESAPGVVVPLVTRAAAAACEARLGEAGIAIRIDHRPAGLEGEESNGDRPMDTPPRSLLSSLRDRPGTTLAAVVGAALAVAILVSTAGDWLPGSASNDDTIDMLEVAALAEAATVHLSCGHQLGAGFFVTSELVVTNAHVLCPGDSNVSVTLSNGRTVQGRVLQTDRWLDIGLVSVPGAAASPLPLGDASDLERGESVVMMGSPRGMDFTFSQGIVSHPNRIVMGVSYVQIDAAVNPGNSGGPLLDRAGRAVGIVSMMVTSASNLGLALPVNYLVDGVNPVLSTAAADYDRQQWAARIDAAAEADRQEVAEARANANRTGVVGAQLVDRGEVVAVVVRMSKTRPNDSHVGFSLSRSGTVVCSPSGIASRWQRVTPGIDENRDPRYLMWLERHGLAQEIYVSPVRLGMTGCPDPASVIGATLTLRHGAAYADQVIIGSGQTWGR
jgi:S1-C subfamily serine protease